MIYMSRDAEPRDVKAIMSAFRGRPLILSKCSSYRSSDEILVSNDMLASSNLSLIDPVVYVVALVCCLSCLLAGFSDLTCCNGPRYLNLTWNCFYTVVGELALDNIKFG
jgi:hypothetical protein